MSQENQKTLEVYAQHYDTYAKNTIAHDLLDPDKAAQKRAKLHDFIRHNFAKFPPQTSKIVEIGAATGEESRYLASLGYDVLATDATSGFLSDLSIDGIRTQTFNILEDEFPYPVDGILCWRVFVHFTVLDLKIALQKCYDALKPGGRLIFNVMNRAAHDVDAQWVDFPNEYHMGAERYYHYFDNNEMFRILGRIGFRTVNFFQEGGDNKNKWLVFVVEV